MAGLKIWGTDPADQPVARQKYADDTVGFFRAGAQVNDAPVSLSQWRVTTGDPALAEYIHELLGGDAPQEWEAKGEDNLEVFTASEAVDIIVDRPTDLRQRMTLWGNDRKPVYSSDGEFILDDNGHPTDQHDPDADLTFAERKEKKAWGANPDISLRFRLADDPDRGYFRYSSRSWGLASDLAYTGVAEALEAVDGPARVQLRLEPVEFIAKSGPRKGKKVSYTKSVIEVKGAA
jgi:hypothetical protein